MATPIGADEFRAAMGSFATGITVVTTDDGKGQRVGVTVSAFASVSLDPPLCLVCIGKASPLVRAVRDAGVFAVNMLAAEQDEVSQRFAFGPGDRFAETDWTPGTVTGCPVFAGTAASVECELKEALPGGDHDVLLGTVVWATVSSERHPLLYWRGRYGDIAPR